MGEDLGAGAERSMCETIAADAAIVFMSAKENAEKGRGESIRCVRIRV